MSVNSYRCCKHCAEDSVHDVAPDRHELDCGLCLRGDAYAAGYAAGLSAHVATPTRPGDVRGTDHTKETGDE